MSSRDDRRPPAAPQPAMKEADQAATEASQGYPDKAILNVTRAELKSAPDFQYASSPLSESDARPAAGGVQVNKSTTP